MRRGLIAAAKGSREIGFSIQTQNISWPWKQTALLRWHLVTHFQAVCTSTDWSGCCMSSGLHQAPLYLTYTQAAQSDCRAHRDPKTFCTAQDLRFNCITGPEHGTHRSDYQHPIYIHTPAQCWVCLDTSSGHQRVSPSMGQSPCFCCTAPTLLCHGQQLCCILGCFFEQCLLCIRLVPAEKLFGLGSCHALSCSHSPHPWGPGCKILSAHLAKRPEQPEVLRVQQGHYLGLE